MSIDNLAHLPKLIVIFYDKIDLNDRVLNENKNFLKQDYNAYRSPLDEK